MADQKHDRPVGADAAEVVTAEQGSSISATARHTEGPWEIFARGTNANPTCAIAKVQGPIVAQTVGGNDEANAEFIVRAVNSHDELLAALKEVERHHVSINAEAGRDESRSMTLRIVRNAIQKAEGR
jgi:hypothetical protein